MQSLKANVAPMEGFTTFPMRVWLYMVSRPEAMTTPFLRVTRAHPNGELPLLFAPELNLLRGVFPYDLTPQLITADTDLFLQAAELLPPEVSPMIELNCGCPSPSCVGKDAGSGILRDPERFGKKVRLISDRLGAGRLAVKMRLGVDDPTEFHQLLEQVASLPLGRLTIHGRTRADRYRGKARWDLIGAAANQSHLQVWASGDICGMETANDLLSTAPKIAGAMIGRGLLRNPWVFEEIRTGSHQRLEVTTLANTLLCYALLQELSIQSPEKLLSKMRRGRFISYCGTDSARWESMTAELSELAGSVPIVLSSPRNIPPIRISQTSYARLRMVWNYLRSSLPDVYFTPKLLRAKNAEDFFSLLLSLSNDSIELSHNPTWDDLYGGARG